jgi:peptidoglycan lytic transglycosylase D
LGRLKAFLCLAFVAALGGCATSQRPKAVVQPPVAAVAPPPEPAPQPATPKVEPIPVPPPDHVAILIQHAEAFYNSGIKEYRAGNFDKAKVQFDQAVSLLLESKLDLTSDERLNKEFEKLVNSIHGLEVASLENGNSPMDRKEEPTAIESFSGLTFPVDPNTKEQAQQELKSVHSDLPLVSNDLVDGVLTYFQGRGRGFIVKILKRLGAYQPIFNEVLNREGVPQELVYLAAAESGFNPLARSRVGAKGIWQFMPGTGALYGLKRNSWVDEREDPEKSTDAAARHLKDLYNTFGDWYLAMAAYDSGPMTVQRAIERTGYADFWTLRGMHALPKETENYVPIFIATAMIAKDPKAYGFDVEPDPPLAIDKVVVSEPTDLRLIAELIDHPVDDLIKLNPSLLRWTTPVNDPEFKLNLPAGTAGIYEEAVASIPADKRIWWRSHKVDGGETVASIAQKFKISTVALASANGIERDADLDEGTRLVLPLAPGSESSLQRVHERVSRQRIHYRIRRGDTLSMLADRFDVSSYQIRRWNHLKSDRLIAGRTLLVYAGAAAPVSRRTRSPKKTSTKKKTSTSKASQAGNRTKTAKKNAAPPARAGR